MNNEALNYGHGLFTNNGYKGTVDDFANLLSTNPDAVGQVYSLFQNDGYKGSTDDFVNLFNQSKPVTEKNVEQEEVKSWQGFKNSIFNLAEQIGDLPEYYGITGDDKGGTARSTLDVLSTTLNESIFGKENLLKWKKQGGIAGWAFEDYIPSDSEEFIEKIESFKKEREKQLPTVNIKKAIEDKDPGRILSGIASSIPMVGGSVVYNMGTAYTGFFADFATENIIEANTIKAESQGQTLNEFIKEGNELDVVRPLQIAALQQGLEYIAVGRLTKAIGGKNLSKIYGKKLAGYLSKRKNTRIGLDIISTGGTEATTEMSQYGLGEYNKALAEGKASGEDVNFFEVVGNAMFSDEGIESGLQGFFGSSGLRGGGYSVKAMSNMRKKVNALDVEKDFTDLISVQRELAKTTDEDVRVGLEEKITLLQKSLKDKIKKGNNIYNSLSEGDIQTIENQGDLADAAAFRITQLNEKLNKGEINQNQYDSTIDIFLEKYKNANNKIVEIASKKVTETVKEQIKEAGLEGEVTEMTSEEISNIEEEGFNSKEAAKQFGFIRQNTDGSFEITLNKDKPMVGTAAHEFMHAVLFKTLGNQQQLQDNLGDALVDHVSELGGETSVLGERLKAYGKFNKEGVFERDANFGEETITIMSEEIINGNLKFNENFFTKIGDIVRRFSQNYLGKEITFDTGRDVYNFVKDYSKSIKDGKINKAILKVAKEGAKGKLVESKADPKAATQMSKATPLEAINELIPDNVKTQDDYYALLDDPKVTNRILDAKGNLAPVIEAYIRSRSTSPEMAQKNIEAVRDRLVNFDPAAERADGSIVGPEGFGEFIFANARFGKMVAAEKLAIEAAERKRTKSIDTEEAMQIADKPTKKKPELKSQKRREIQSLSNVYGVANEVNLNNKIQALIEKNPKNLEAEIRNLIEKDIRKAITKQMGKISKIKGEVVISDEYKAFLAFNYENIAQGLDVATIKKNYNQLFELTEIGKEDRKTRKADKPSLKKDSNYRKGIFKIETNKAKFTKFFTEGGYTTLLDRQKKLAILIGESITENIINDQIIENSKNLNDITKVKMKEFANSLNRQKKEVQGNYNDQIKFSKNAIKDADTLFLLVQEKGLKNVYNDNGKLLLGIKNTLLEKRSTKAADFIYSIAKQGFIQDLSDLQYISKKFQKIYKAGERGTAYESTIIDTIKELEAEFGEATVYAVLRKPTEADALPDVVMKIHNTLLNIEAKMSNAQYSSVTFAVDEKGNFNIKKDYSFNDQILPLGKQVQKGIKAAKARLKKEDYDWSDISIIPTDLYNILKSEPVTIDGVEYSSYINAMSATMPISLDVVSEIYNNKKHPVNYMHMMGKGLFYMGGYNNETNVLGTPELKGDAEITLRIGSNSQKQTVTIQEGVKMKIKTGNTKISWRAIPTIPNNTLEKLKPHSKTLDTKAGIKNIINSKEGKALAFSKSTNERKTLAKAILFSRSANNPNKGITVLDFDDTLATTKSLVKYTTPDGETGTLNAEQYASTYEDLLDQGFTFDFSDFNKVVKGKIAPLFQKAIKLQGKFGPENMFVLTARPPASQKAIFDFLKGNGLNIPLKNITGLGNSTAEAKALWIADKVGEGYNDFYFADDALQNVQAVKNMLDQFDVKSKVQQAKVKFSKDINTDFNNILEDITGIESKKRFSDIKARKRGKKKGKFRFFIPPSHEDFVGLLYNFMGKGRKGDQHRDFFEQALVRPLNRAYREIDTAKQAIANDYKELNKQFADVKKKLTKKTPDGDFIFEDAIRVYLWNKHGYDIPGLSPTDQQNLVDLVMQDAELRSYAETLNTISKQDKYVDPGQGWEGGNIKTDLIDATGRVGRAEYFAEFNENADILFSPENLNKIEAAYGKDFRSALEDILHRISTGINRPKGQSGTVNSFMNYLNGSVGTVMFFNVRSAILQQMSIVNYINFADNNIFAAAKAFANQPQYWKDFAFIFNSDMLKQRRGGIGTDINGNDLAQAVKGSKDPTKVVISRLLQLGFLPTQIGDNIAIATGGATFYRNRINKYIKDGLSKKEAETRAFTDFQDLTQSTQQSSRPDMTSKQQSSWIGKLVLNFQNITSQYNRIIKKAALDIGKGRISPPYTTKAQSNLGNLSKILYYGAIQNVIFYSLQTALFAVMFGDDEDEEQILKKRERVINGSIDSILRGAGIYGAVLSTLKNTLIKFKEQREKGYNKDESAVALELANFSPVLGIKLRQIVNAEKTLNYNENVIGEMETFNADNPQWSAVTNYTQALTNFPANRLYQKSINMRNALDKDYTNFQRVLFFSGYTTWSLGLGDTEAIVEAKEKVKINKANARKEKRVQKQIEKIEANKSIIEENKKKKDGRCANVNASGNRCQNKAIKDGMCTIHEKTEKISGGRKVQCRKRKADGSRCKMQTANKSQYCYYHD